MLVWTIVVCWQPCHPIDKITSCCVHCPNHVPNKICRYKQRGQCIVVINGPWYAMPRGYWAVVEAILHFMYFCPGCKQRKISPVQRCEHPSAQNNSRSTVIPGSHVRQWPLASTFLGPLQWQGSNYWQMVWHSTDNIWAIHVICTDTPPPVLLRLSRVNDMSCIHCCCDHNR